MTVRGVTVTVEKKSATAMKAPGATLPLACSCHMSPHVSQRVVTLDESRLSAEIFETDLSVVTTPFSFSKNAAGIRLCGVIFSVAVIRP